MLFYEKLCSYLSIPRNNRHPNEIEGAKILKDAEIFCIQPQNIFPILGDESSITHDPDGYKGELDSPFKTIWIEMSKINGKEQLISVGGNEDVNVNCMGLLIHEVSPKLYKIWSFLDVEGLRDTKDRQYMLVESSLFSDISKSLIDRINQESWGLETPRMKVKIGSGHSKTIKRIKSIIHISPKRNIKHVKSATNHSINWSYAWNVRGHWRKINGIGKARDGVELVVGHTWVKSYVKGNGEIVKKTRLVKS